MVWELAGQGSVAVDVGVRQNLCHNKYILKSPITPIYQFPTSKLSTTTKIPYIKVMKECWSQNKDLKLINGLTLADMKTRFLVLCKPTCCA